MIENRIESFSELENALSNLSNLSEEVASTLRESQSIYEDQGQAWYSANSTSESEKMMNYAEESEKIAKNVQEVSGAIQRFKTATQNIDETK